MFNIDMKFGKTKRNNVKKTKAITRNRTIIRDFKAKRYMYLNLENVNHTRFGFMVAGILKVGLLYVYPQSNFPTTLSNASFFIISVLTKELMKQPGTCMSVFIIITCLNASYQKYMRFVARKLEKTKAGSCFSVNFRLDGFV